MKNAGLAGAIALCGIGLMMIGLGNFVKAPTAMAYTPSITAAVQDEGEPTIVWYSVEAAQQQSGNDNPTIYHMVYRAWSDGTVERRAVLTRYNESGDVFTLSCFEDTVPCLSSWEVISSPTEGLNAAADITFDEVVDGQDLATLLASWGEAPRNPMPPSDCPLGLMN